MRLLRAQYLPSHREHLGLSKQTISDPSLTLSASPKPPPQGFQGAILSPGFLHTQSPTQVLTPGRQAKGLGLSLCSLHTDKGPGFLAELHPLRTPGTLPISWVLLPTQHRLSMAMGRVRPSAKAILPPLCHVPSSAPNLGLRSPRRTAQKPGSASRPFPTLGRGPQTGIVGGLPAPPVVARPLTVRGGTFCTQARAPDVQTQHLLPPRLGIQELQTKPLRTPKGQGGSLLFCIGAPCLWAAQDPGPHPSLDKSGLSLATNRNPQNKR